MMFLLLFFGLAPGIALALLWRGVRRCARASNKRGHIVCVTAGALGLWAVASYFMMFFVFVVTYGLNHARPLPPGMFPEGWPIYGLLALYTAFGGLLIAAIGKIPAPGHRTGHRS